MVHADFLANYWTPAYQLRSVLVLVHALLGTPNFDEPCGQLYTRPQWIAAMTAYNVRQLRNPYFLLWINKRASIELPLELWINVMLLSQPRAHISMQELATISSVTPQQFERACDVEAATYSNPDKPRKQ